MLKHTKRQVKSKMRFIIMFVTAVCFMFLIKLKWPKSKNIHDLTSFVPNAECERLSKKLGQLQPLNIKGLQLSEVKLNLFVKLFYFEGPYSLLNF